VSIAGASRPTTQNDVTDFASHHGWPVVVKPRNGFACIGTHLVNSEKDLFELGPLDRRPMMVEAYQHGIEYELCALFQHGRRTRSVSLINARAPSGDRRWRHECQHHIPATFRCNPTTSHRK
jgi:D-alanine-D-alanine ligase-like ATP-grasp enzyme